MLTPADDFPIHQTPDPIALSQGDRNFYDRFFFNGYSQDGATFFAMAMGFYPQLGIVDAAFSVQRDGVQHNVRTSKHVALLDRMDLSVGPLHIEIEEPLRRAKLHIDHDAIQASLEFSARCPFLLEPRFQKDFGDQIFMDYTRMTQNGEWQGTIAVEGHSMSVAGHLGTRDRSWGIRPLSGTLPSPADIEPHFFWIWTPINFDDGSIFYHLNADRKGVPWNESGARVPLLGSDASIDGGPFGWDGAESQLKVHEQTRRIEQMTILLRRDHNGSPEQLEVTLSPFQTFYMSGLGYTHATWGHGELRGELETAYDQIELASVADTELPFRHIQALCKATIEGQDSHGIGVIEQLLIGPTTSPRPRNSSGLGF